MSMTIHAARSGTLKTSLDTADGREQVRVASSDVVRSKSTLFFSSRIVAATRTAAGGYSSLKMLPMFQMVP